MNTYPFFPVTLLTFLAFFISWIFAHWDIISVKSHRKIWNYLLLVTFFVSGFLGLLSVIKVNYKLEIPFYEKLLQWHVCFGIAMVFIAFFHLSWHLKYYFSFGNKAENQDSGTTQFDQGDGLRLRAMLFLLGMAAMINQVVFIREFISVLAGNELVMGIVLAFWMLITSWGALRAKKKGTNRFNLKKGMIELWAIAVFPIVMIPVLYLFKKMLFPPGTLINLGHSILATSIVLFPVCFLSGYLFTVFSGLYSDFNKSNLVGKSYAVESLGSLLGGVLFSLFLGRFFNSLQVISITSAMVLFTGSFLFKGKKKHFDWRLFLSALVIPVLVFVFNPDKLIKKTLYPNQVILQNISTRYGNITVTEQAGQLNVYEDNALLFYTENTITNEEAVHYAMVQHPAPKQILLISGGMAGMIPEILKYNVDKITYLESNPELFHLFKNRNDLWLDDSRIEMVNKDIRKFLSNTDHTYDAILINLPPPTSLGLNRFYTQEFYDILKKHSNEQSVICTSLQSTANYAGDNALLANSSLWKTLGLNFENQLLVMGESNYFLASNSPLKMDIAEIISEKNIATEYVNPYYLDDRLLAMRSEDFVALFDDTVPVNRDLYPYMFVQQINYWLSYFGLPYKLIILVPVLLFLALFFRTDRITVGLYTGGFTAASLEVVLLLVYQIYFGSIYLATAMFFAVFMAGLAFGSSGRIKNKLPIIQNYYLLQFFIAVFAVLLPFVVGIKGLASGPLFIGQFLFFTLIFLLASAIGYEFLLASQLQRKNYNEISGINYSTDLLGSAFGAFLTALVLLPLLGIVKTCILVALLNIISGILAFSTRKSIVMPA